MSANSKDYLSRTKRQQQDKMPCVIIFTALSLEYKSVRAHLTELEPEKNNRGSLYERGQFHGSKQTWDVVIVETGMGNISAAMEVERAIANYNPIAVFFVGIAGGLKDVSIGDVVAATKVYGYESGVAENIFKPRPDLGESSYILEQRARAEIKSEDWLSRIPQMNAIEKPKAYIGPIAAGEKVIKSTSSSIYKFLQNFYSDALAVDMEGRGFLKAARANEVNAMLIRGISDLLDNKQKADSKGSQEIAAMHASAFTFQMLSNLSPIIQTIGSGLNLISEFSSKSLSALEFNIGPKEVRAEQVDDSLKVGGLYETETIREDEIKLNEWDEVRYEALKKRVKINWEMYNDIFAEMPSYSIDEKARLKQRLNQIREELCPDFYEMLDMFERTLAIDLDEYQSLNDVCD